MKRHLTKGFTLIELLIAVAVVSILFGLAIPSFMSVIRTNTLTSQSNLFVAAIALTRGEAIKRGTTARLCIRDGNTCSAGNGDAWGQGWILYSDVNNNEQLDEDEAVRYFDEIKYNYSLIASDSNINSISYDQQGRLVSQTAFSMWLCASDAEASNDVSRSRTLTFNTIGRVRPSAGTPSCP